jgi:putative phosphoesterase
MRIGILSDTHDQLARTMAAVALLRHEGIEALFHCGDLTGPDIVHACGTLPFYFVYGNNDDDWPMLKRAAVEVQGACLEWSGVVELAGRRIAVAHGHLTRDLRALTAQRPDFLLYGHSHLAADEHRDGVRWINPGALHRAARFTVAVLDLGSAELRFLEVPR